MDVEPAAPPLVGPRERDRAACAFLERRADVHRRDSRLPILALADAVGASLGEQQRLVASDVLQPCQVRAQIGFAVQVDVERADVEEREIEKLSGRKVDVRQQRIGRGRLRVFVQAAQEVFDADIAVPPHDAGRNLVAERHHQHRGMAAELAHLRNDVAPDSRCELPVVEKRHVLGPGQAGHDPQAVTRGFVEKISARRRVRADGIDADVRHEAEVFGDALA